MKISSRIFCILGFYIALFLLVFVKPFSVCISAELEEFKPLTILPADVVDTLFRKYSVKKYESGPAKIFVIMSTADNRQVQFAVKLLSRNFNSTLQDSSQSVPAMFEVHFFFDDFDESRAFSWIMLCKNKEFKDFLTTNSGTTLSPRDVILCQSWFEKLKILSEDLERFLKSVFIDVDRLVYPVLILSDGRVYDFVSLNMDWNAYEKVIDSLVKDFPETPKNKGN